MLQGKVVYDGLHVSKFLVVIHKIHICQCFKIVVFNCGLKATGKIMLNAKNNARKQFFVFLISEQSCGFICLKNC